MCCAIHLETGLRSSKLLEIQRLYKISQQIEYLFNVNIYKLNVCTFFKGKLMETISSAAYKVSPKPVKVLKLGDAHHLLLQHIKSGYLSKSASDPQNY